MSIRTRELQRIWQAALLLLAAAIIIMIPELAWATDTRAGSTTCSASGWFQGNIGKGLATVGITIMGIGCTLGRMSWGTVMMIGVGIAILFGADALVTALHVIPSSASCSTAA